MDFALPPVGEGLIEVELLRWLVKPGDPVTRGQSLLEVMSDKATMEVPSPFAGSVTATLGTPGEKLTVGDVVLRYQTAAAVSVLTGEPEASAPGVSSGKTPVAHASGSPGSAETAPAVW